MLHLVHPEWSYRLNAAFEAHAERQYMIFVDQHPELEETRFDGPLAARFAEPVSIADVLRQIGHDERMHRLDSQERAVEHAASRR